MGRRPADQGVDELDHVIGQPDSSLSGHTKTVPYWNATKLRSRLRPAARLAFRLANLQAQLPSPKCLAPMSWTPTSLTRLGSKARFRHEVSDRNLGTLRLGDERPSRGLKAGSFRGLHNSLAESALSPQAHNAVTVRKVSEGNHADHGAQSQPADRSQALLPSQARLCPLDRTGRNHLIGMQFTTRSRALYRLAHMGIQRPKRHSTAT